ncbi:hypothetical protein KA005_64070, partial [bacterium]|nr:hypothetical protein [bacterium]
MQRNVFIILFTLVLFFSASSFVHAADFEQNYGDCDTDYHTVSSGTYSFTVNGIFAHKYTKWWVYDGSWDYKETDESWWGNGYYDPVFSHYFGSGTIYVDADVYDGDWNFECTYRWVITVSTPQSSTTTIGNSSSSTTTIGYSSSSSSTTTIGNSSSTTTIIPIENYIGTDENNSDVPDYGNYNTTGICGATASASALAYWDTYAYATKIYWNLIDNGLAP